MTYHIFFLQFCVPLNLQKSLYRLYSPQVFISLSVEILSDYSDFNSAFDGFCVAVLPVKMKAKSIPISCWDGFWGGL